MAQNPAVRGGSEQLSFDVAVSSRKAVGLVLKMTNDHPQFFRKNDTVGFFEFCERI